MDGEFQRIIFIVNERRKPSGCDTHSNFCSASIPFEPSIDHLKVPRLA